MLDFLGTTLKKYISLHRDPPGGTPQSLARLSGLHLEPRPAVTYANIIVSCCSALESTLESAMLLKESNLYAFERIICFIIASFVIYSLDFASYKSFVYAYYILHWGNAKQQSKIQIQAN